MTGSGRGTSAISATPDGRAGRPRPPSDRRCSHRDEHLFHPSSQPEDAVVVAGGEVACAEPAVDERLRRARRVVPVARHHAGEVSQSSPTSPSGSEGRLIADVGLDPRARSADRVQRLVVVGVEGGADPDAAALGRAVANRVRGAEDPTGLLNERRGDAAPPATIAFT